VVDPGAEAPLPSSAGWWLGCVSLPVFQFLLLRRYFRLVIWARFLWQVSRLELALVPTIGRSRPHALARGRWRSTFTYGTNFGFLRGRARHRG